MNFLILCIGVALGAVLTLLFFYHGSGYGYYVVTPYDDEDTGFYNVNFRLPSQQGDLSRKKRIILYREEQPSQK